MTRLCALALALALALAGALGGCVSVSSGGGRTEASFRMGNIHGLTVSGHGDAFSLRAHDGDLVAERASRRVIVRGAADMGRVEIHTVDAPDEHALDIAFPERGTALAWHGDEVSFAGRRYDTKAEGTYVLVASGELIEHP